MDAFSPLSGIDLNARGESLDGVMNVPAAVNCETNGRTCISIDSNPAAASAYHPRRPRRRRRLECGKRYSRRRLRRGNGFLSFGHAVCVHTQQRLGLKTDGRLRELTGGITQPCASLQSHPCYALPGHVWERVRSVWPLSRADFLSSESAPRIVRAKYRSLREISSNM